MEWQLCLSYKAPGNSGRVCVAVSKDGDPKISTVALFGTNKVMSQPIWNFLQQEMGRKWGSPLVGVVTGRLETFPKK